VNYNPSVKNYANNPLLLRGVLCQGLRIKLSSDPLKSWLEKQGVTDFSGAEMESESSQRPQSIMID
jgi:hypothetical protein